MSKLKIVPKRKNTMSILRINDGKYDSSLDLWVYPDCIMIECNGEIVSINHNQFATIKKFVYKQKRY